MAAAAAFDDPLSDLGPRLPSRMQVYRQAEELERLARLARELATSGPHADLPRAVRQLDKARALLGGGHG